MGKRKKRGPSADRKLGLQEIVRLAHQAKCDPDVYLFLTNIYSAAARRTMPVKGGPFRKPDEPGSWLVLSDIPINRGMMAVVGELRSMQIDGPLLHAYIMRVMDFGQVFENRDQVTEFIKDGDEPGAVVVNEALIRAVAVADYIIEGDKSKLDINSVLGHVRRITKELETAEAAAASGEALASPPYPAHVDLRDEPIRRDAFVQMAMDQFGVTRDEAERMVDETIEKVDRMKPH